METDFLERCIVKIQGVIFFILKECRFRLDIKKKKIFAMKLVTFPSLKMFSATWMGLWQPILVESVPLMVGGWKWMIFKVLPKPNHFVIP